MELIFKGAAGTVTGSRSLLKYRNQLVMVDCGLYQGPKRLRELNWQCGIDPKDLHCIILTHAHIDHSGLIPRLVKQGFRGKVYTNQATFELCQVMLRDAARIQEEDAKFANQSGYSNHRPALALYDSEDAEQALKLFSIIDRNQWVEILPTLSIRLIRAGHILGASSVEIRYLEQNNGHPKILSFSGDIGSFHSTIIQPPEFLTQCDELVMESTYGDRLQNKESPLKKLSQVVCRVCERKGVLLIPAFSVGRAQEILHLLGLLLEENHIPKVPIVLDSPMATKATEIFKKHPEEHMLFIKKGYLVSPLSDTSYFYMTQTVEESKHLNLREGPMVIVSSSGMLTGGRIMHHLKTRLTDEKNCILFTGYQAEQTKGRLLINGIESLRIHHEEFAVRAEILMLDELSGHADQEEMLQWLAAIEQKPKRIFLNHGEDQARKVFASKISEIYPEIEVICPQENDAFEL